MSDVIRAVQTAAGRPSYSGKGLSEDTRARMVKWILEPDQTFTDIQFRNLSRLGRLYPNDLGRAVRLVQFGCRDKISKRRMAELSQRCRHCGAKE